MTSILAGATSAKGSEAASRQEEPRNQFPGSCCFSPVTRRQASGEAGGGGRYGGEAASSPRVEPTPSLKIPWPGA